MTTLVKQNTSIPTRKKLFQDTAQFGIVAAAWGLHQFGGIDIPPGLEGLAVALVGGWVGYYAKERLV